MVLFAIFDEDVGQRDMLREEVAVFLVVVGYECAANVKRAGRGDGVKENLLDGLVGFLGSRRGGGRGPGGGRGGGGACQTLSLK